MGEEFNPMYQLLLGDVIARNARKFPDKTALIWEKGSMSYGEFNERINAFSHSLKQMGVGKGDKVALLLPNGREILEACYAVFKIGAIAVPINFRLASNEIEYILNNSDAKILVLGCEFIENVKEIRRNVSLVREFIVVGGEFEKDIKQYDELVKGERNQEPSIVLSDDDDALILYTSGTTGLPKGAVISHKSFLNNAISWAMAYHTEYNDVLLCIPPLFHVASLGYTLTQFYVGAAVYVDKVFEPVKSWVIITREKITTLFLVPAMWIQLLQVDNIRSYDCSSLRILNTGASIMPVEVKKHILETFPNAGIFDCFGQTEMNGGVTILDARDALRKPGSIGKAVPLVEIRLIDDEGQEVSVGEVGEAIYRGATVTKGYYKNPEATIEAMKGGWFHSGDLLRKDAEGFYYVVDRKKDMIISGGENIYPAEIEAVLYSHPEILEAAVIGVPDPDWGESVRALLVLKSGKSITEKAVIEHCRTKLAGYKKPRFVDFVDVLPKNSGGKVLKNLIREKYWIGHNRKI